MNPLLASIVEQPVPQRKMLKKDWSAEEKAWRANIGQFVGMISSANHECCAHEKKEEKKEDSVKLDVIIKHDKAGESVVDPLAKTPKSPAQPKDVPMTTDIDDLFGLPSETPKKTEEPKTEPKADVFASAGKESSVDGFPPEPPKATVSEPVAEKPDEDKHKTKPIPNDLSLCEGFRANDFQTKVMSVVESILATTPTADLEQMADSIDDYRVTISVDAYRSDLDSISNHIAEVQAKRDSVVSCLIKLSATSLALDEVLDFAVNIGVSCSTASNRERRVSEVHYMAADLFKRYVHVKHLHDSYDKLYRHLGSQMEALSRLLTAQIERAKSVYMGSQRHSELQEVAKQSESPRQTPVVSIDMQKEVERVRVEENLLQTSHAAVAETAFPFDSGAAPVPAPAKVTQAVEGLSGLETFSAAPVKKDKFRKGVVEW